MSTSVQTAGSAGSDKSRLTLAMLFFCVVMAEFLICGMMISGESITLHFFRSQDRYLAVASIGIVLVALVWKTNLALPRYAPSRRQILIGAFLLTGLLWLGTYLLMFNYPLTRDEHMVAFDLGIFSSGKLAAPLPAEWSGYATALVPNFLLDVPNHKVLVSAYMPMNAAVRAAFGLLFDPALMNPLLTGVGLILSYKIAQRLFARSVGAMWTILIGYTLSAQILFNAMTDYAMTGHLVLNLLWLLLFLDGRKAALAWMMAIGFIAIGYHQIIFHPLFAAPFIMTFAFRRQWGTFAAFVVAYGAAGLFWISYPNLLLSLHGISVDTGSAANARGFIAERILPLFTGRNPSELLYTFFNLIRAVTWAPIFIFPFLILAWPAIRRAEGIAAQLAAGIALTVVAMMVLLPSQGHGWGYRYLHPVMGNLLILAGYGYRRIASNEQAAADRMVILLGAGTLLVCLPFLTWSTRAFVEPYANLTQLVKRQASDFVIVDTESPSAAIDQVRNDADLTSRPLIFSSKDLAEHQVAHLCRSGSVTLISRDQFGLVGFYPNQPQKTTFETVEHLLAGKDCLRQPI